MTPVVFQSAAARSRCGRINHVKTQNCTHGQLVFAGINSTLPAAISLLRLSNSKRGPTAVTVSIGLCPASPLIKLGNAAIGYAVSSSIHLPRYSLRGRLESDPPGNLGQGEATCSTARASKRRGTAGAIIAILTIDPADGMSFWHVNEYLAANGANWHQRIGKFDFVGGGPCPTPQYTDRHSTATPVLQLGGRR